MRMECDVGKTLAPTFDCCFHSETLTYGAKNMAFRDLIVSTARDAATQEYKKINDRAEIEEAYHILKGTKYKNGNPAIMLVDSISQPTSMALEQSRSTTTRKDCIRGKDEATDAPMKTEEKQRTTTRKDSSFKKGFLLKSSTNVSKDTGKNAPAIHQVRNGEMADDRTITPYYEEVIERGEFELVDHTVDGFTRPSTRPKFLEYRIYLPQIKALSGVDLDVSAERLVLKASSTKKNVFSRSTYPIQFSTTMELQNLIRHLRH